ncbi:MAG: helix-hairpin-helix domain-containing protein [Marinilabiliaceae bacterium]|nr:helix-hairpin-helix domain-containing protein [Marinilabiliaceae bacterium]
MNKNTNPREFWGWLSILIVCLLAIFCWELYLRHRGTPIITDSTQYLFEEYNGENTLTTTDDDTLYVNSANATQLSRFGFPNYVVLNILKYRDAGGSFREINALRGVHGIDSLFLSNKASLINYEVSNTQTTYIYKYIYKGGSSDKKYPTANHPTRIGLYYANADTLLLLGVRKEVIDTILLYRDRFILTGSISLDSLKILTALDISEVLKPHIKGQKKSYHSDDNYTQRIATAVNTPRIELNSATLEELCTIKGIKEKTASLIVSRRSVLGGFVDTKQLLEINIIDSARYELIAPQITISTKNVTLIDVNKATKKELKRHPYMNDEIVNRLLKERYLYKKITPEILDDILLQEKKKEWLIQYIKL